MSERLRSFRSLDGFSLVETVVVLGLVTVVLAISIPQVMGAARRNRLKAAAQDVADAVKSARRVAIKEQARLGVVFLLTSDSTYQFGREDSAPLEGDPPRPLLADLFGEDSLRERLGPSGQLPPGIVFVPSCLGLPTTTSGLRYQGNGLRCLETGTGEPCPSIDWPPALVQQLPDGQAFICLEDTSTSKRMGVSVMRSGSVRLWEDLL